MAQFEMLETFKEITIKPAMCIQQESLMISEVKNGIRELFT